jgi:hypothetical protein
MTRHVLHLRIHVRVVLHGNASKLVVGRLVCTIVLLRLHGIELLVLWIWHRHSLVHVWCSRYRVRERRASSSLMWRVREGHLSGLALKWGCHSTSTLWLRVSELLRIGRWKSHLLLWVLRRKVAPAPAALSSESSTTSTILVIHIVLGRLGRFTAQMSCLLISWCQRGLCARGLSHVTIAIATETAKS